MSYLQPTQESHPDGYNGLYSAVELKKGIINFISIDRQQNGHRLLATADIILGLKTMYNIEFDFHSVEYVMRNMLSKEGSKEVGTTTVNSVVKKCEDGIHRTFVTHERNNKTDTKEISTESDIPCNLTEDELRLQYRKLNNAFILGKTNKCPGTFPEFKKNLGY